MKNVPVHHLHIKYHGDIFTIYHCSDVMSMSDLYRVIREIKDFENDKK